MRMPDSWLTFLLIAVWIPGVHAAQAQPMESHDPTITVADVLDRIERAGRIQPDSAGLMKEGMRQMNHPVAELEMALLEIYGPAAERDLARGLERLASLQAGDSTLLPAETRRLLAVLVAHISERMELDDQLQLAAARLERERRAHLNTLEKLDALRQIERQLESRQEGSSEPNRVQ